MYLKYVLTTRTHRMYIFTFHTHILTIHIYLPYVNFSPYVLTTCTLLLIMYLPHMRIYVPCTYRMYLLTKVFWHIQRLMNENIAQLIIKTNVLFFHIYISVKLSVSRPLTSHCLSTSDPHPHCLSTGLLTLSYTFNQWAKPKNVDVGKMKINAWQINVEIQYMEKTISCSQNNKTQMNVSKNRYESVF